MIWIPSVLMEFSLRTFTREVKVMQSYFILEIKHGSFPSLCIGDNRETVLEYHSICTFVYIINFRNVLFDALYQAIT